jgi:hypothetical protein
LAVPRLTESVDPGPEESGWHRSCPVRPVPACSPVITGSASGVTCVGRSEPKARRWLAGDAGAEVEVRVQVQHGKPSEVSNGGNQQVGNRRRAALALVCQCQLDLNGSDAETARNVGPFHLLRPAERALRAHRPRPRAGLDLRMSRCPAKPLADVYAILSFYLRHRTDVESHLRDQEQEGAKLQQRIESFYPPDGLRARLLARPDS